MVFIVGKKHQNHIVRKVATIEETKVTSSVIYLGNYYFFKSDSDVFFWTTYLKICRNKVNYYY